MVVTVLDEEYKLPVYPLRDFSLPPWCSRGFDLLGYYAAYAGNCFLHPILTKAQSCSLPVQ